MFPMDQNKQKKRVSRRSVSLLLVAAMLIALCVPTSMALSDEEQTPELSAQTATVPETSDTSESVPESDASDLSASVDADAAISSDGDTASDPAAAQTTGDDASADPASVSANEDVQQDKKDDAAQDDSNDQNQAEENDADDTVEVGYYIYGGDFEVDTQAGKGNNDNSTSDTHYAEIYFLADPVGDPLSNETSVWQPSAEQSTLFAPINLKDAQWEADKDGTLRNITKNLSKYITSWPDGSTGATWTVKRNDPASGKYFTQILDMIWNAYKQTIAKQVGVSERELQKDDVLELTLRPRKISKNSCTNTANPNYDKLDKWRDGWTTYYTGYHIDCSLDVKSRKVFTAKFWVQEPGETEYNTYVDGKSYRTGDKVEQTSNIAIGSTKVVNGVTYVLDGWYVEDDTGNAPGEKVTSWNYNPSETELADGTVNFYAHYIAQPVDVTVTKQVVGVSNSDQFTFHYTADGINGSFTLTNGASTKISVPAGAAVTVSEDVFDCDQYTYTTTYQIDGGAAQSGNTATISAAQSGQTITFVNTYSAKTGALTLIKQIDNQGGALTDSELEQVKQNLSFTITSGTTSYTVNTSEHMNNWNGDTFQYTWDDLPVGSTWTVSESGEEMTYATVSTVYDQSSATITAGAEAQLKVTNTYTPVLVDLVINKRVVGENLKAGSFTFTARNDRTGITYTATIVTKDDGTATISGIPAGTYTVVELENDNYTCTNSTQTVNIPSGSNTVTFENKGTGDSFQSSSAAVNQYSGIGNDFRVMFQRLKTMLTDNH